MVQEERQPAAFGGNLMEPGTGDPAGVIADANRLEEICGLPAAQQSPLDAACRGVLAETALTGRQRYEWRLLLPLLHSLVDAVVADFAPQQQDEGEVGPPRPPLPGFESPPAVAAQLHSLLDSHDAAPFTLQRLCELLLEPRRQYARLDKVALAIEKLLVVTSTRQPDPPHSLPPPPALRTLAGVNCNPPSPYLDGRPPAVLDAEQRQALLQQHQAALSAAQHAGLLGGAPNGLEDGPPLAGPAQEEEQGGAAAAAGPGRSAPEAMQLDAGGPLDYPAPEAAAPTAAASSAGRFVESAPAEAGDGAGSGWQPAPDAAYGGGADQQRQQAALAAANGAANAAAPSLAAQHDQHALEGQSLMPGQRQQHGAGRPPDEQRQAEAGSASAADASGAISRLQAALPPSLQPLLLPLLHTQQQQQWLQGGPPGAQQAAEGGAPPADAAAWSRLVLTGLSALPHEQKAAVLSDLQPLLPAHVRAQLEQQHVQ